jgi:ribonuclease III
LNKIIRLISEYLNVRKPSKSDPAWKHKLEKLQRKLGFTFTNETLLQGALTHNSFLNRSDSVLLINSPFERMEFLGDSILGFVVAKELFSKFPELQEGLLSKMKSQIVSEKYLALKALELELGEYIRMSPEEIRNGGKVRPSILSDAMEALICAIYLDSGMVKASAFIKKLVLSNFSNIINQEALTNFKSILQEYSQSRYQVPPIYKVVSEEGPDHEKLFHIDVYVNGNVIGHGDGSSKKAAQQDAAKNACQALSLC